MLKISVVCFSSRSPKILKNAYLFRETFHSARSTMKVFQNKNFCIFFPGTSAEAVLFCFINIYSHMFILAFLIRLQYLLLISYILWKELRAQEPAQLLWLGLMYWPTSKASESHSLIFYQNLIDVLIGLPKYLYLRHLSQERTL